MDFMNANRNPNDPRFYIARNYWLRCSTLAYLITAAHIALSIVASVEMIVFYVHGKYSISMQPYTLLLMFLTCSGLLCYGNFGKKGAWVEGVSEMYLAVAVLVTVFMIYSFHMAIFPDIFARPFMTDDDFRRLLKTSESRNDIFGKYMFISSCYGMIAFLLFNVRMILAKYGRQLIILYGQADGAGEAFIMN